MSGITNAGKFIYDAAEVLMYACSIAAPINGLLTGIIIMQYFQYILGPLSDSSPRRVKVLTTLATLGSVVDLCLTTVTLNRSVVEVIRTPQRILKVPRLFPEEVACTLLSTICVQLYFSEIVYKVLGRSRAWVYVATLLLCTSAAGGLGTIWAFATTGTVLVRPRQPLYGALCLLLQGTWLCASVVFDVIVSGILCVYFALSLKKSSFKTTSDILTYLLVGTLQTFMLTTALAIVGVALIFVPLLQSNNLTIIKFSGANTGYIIFLGRIYTISLLYSVNRREYVQNRMSGLMHGILMPSVNRGVGVSDSDGWMAGLNGRSGSGQSGFTGDKSTGTGTGTGTGGIVGAASEVVPVVTRSVSGGGHGGAGTAAVGWRDVDTLDIKD